MPEPEMVHMRVVFVRGLNQMALAWTLNDPLFPKEYPVLNRGKFKDVNWVIVQVPKTEAARIIKEVSSIDEVAHAELYTPPPKPMLFE